LGLTGFCSYNVDKIEDAILLVNTDVEPTKTNPTLKMKKIILLLRGQKSGEKPHIKRIASS
jgi:hypothetical protein